MMCTLSANWASRAVHQDKIGASNFFWSFPSEAAVKVGTPASLPHCTGNLDDWTTCVRHRMFLPQLVLIINSFINE